jgi:hypothetical protein
MTGLHEPICSERSAEGHRPSGAAARRSLALAIALAATTAAASAMAQPISVMTYNQYFGADISRLLQAPPEAFNATLVDVLRTIAASRFPERAALQARSIAQNRPDFVGLQEVWRLACVDLAPAPVPLGYGCTDPAIAGAFKDQLQVTLAALAALGLDYSAAATVTNFRIDGANGVEGVPFFINGFPALLQFADRDVILVNDQTASNVQPVTFPSPFCRPSDDGCNYNVVLPVPVTVPVPGDDPITFIAPLERGFVAVDATVRGERYRFVNTHLEVKDPPVPAEIQCAQAAELFGILNATTPADRSLLVAGDFNSGPDDVPLPGVLPTPDLLPPAIANACFGAAVVPPYLLLTQLGLNDVWTYRTGAGARRSPRADGYTCCQPETLRNNNSRLNDRIDLVFSQVPPSVILSAQVVGDTVPEKTFPYGRGLWPSDHGGVVTKFQLGTSVAGAPTAGPRLVAAR